MSSVMAVYTTGALPFLSTNLPPMIPAIAPIMAPGKHHKSNVAGFQGVQVPQHQRRHEQHAENRTQGEKGHDDHVAVGLIVEQGEANEGGFCVMDMHQETDHQDHPYRQGPPHRGGDKEEEGTDPSHHEERPRGIESAFAPGLVGQVPPEGRDGPASGGLHHARGDQNGIPL